MKKKHTDTFLSVLHSLDSPVWIEGLKEGRKERSEPASLPTKYALLCSVERKAEGEDNPTRSSGDG